MYTLASFVFLITLIAFVVFWWKKRKARIAAGADYINDHNYQKISKIKRIIGVVCVVSLVIGLATQPERTPEEKAMIAQKQKVREQKSKEEEVSKTVEKIERKFKEPDIKNGRITKYKFWINGVDLVDDDKAIVYWSDEYSLHGGALERHDQTSYLRIISGKWELVASDWKKY